MGEGWVEKVFKDGGSDWHALYGRCLVVYQKVNIGEAIRPYEEVGREVGDFFCGLNTDD